MNYKRRRPCHRLEIYPNPNESEAPAHSRSTWQADREHFSWYDFQGLAAVQLVDRPLGEGTYWPEMVIKAP